MLERTQGEAEVKGFLKGKGLFVLLAAAALLSFGCNATLQPQSDTADTTDTTASTAISVKVVYDGNGATSGTVPAAKEFASGAVVTVAGNTGGLVKAGNDFSGWNTKADGSGTSRAAGSTFTAGTSNVTLYAKWTPGPLLLALDSAGNVFSSGNGAAWTGPVATGLSTGNGIVYANGLFVAVGQDGTNYGVATSSDGLVWTKKNLGGTSAQLTKIETSSGGKLVAAGLSGITVETFLSSDGLAWTGPFATGIPNAVGPGWSGSAWFVASNNGASWKKSPTGETWDGTGLGTTSMYQANAVGSIGGNILLGGGAPGGTTKQVAVSSTGGVSFGEAASVNTAAGYVYAFLADAAAGRILCLGSGTSGQVNYSTDSGVTWTASTGTGSGSFKAGVKWKAGYLVGDSLGSVYASTDGAVFVLSGSAGTAELRGLAYNGVP